MTRRPPDLNRPEHIARRAHERRVALNRESFGRRNVIPIPPAAHDRLVDSLAAVFAQIDQIRGSP
jgi:hypothetical protein